MWAADHGHTDIAIALVKAKGNINVKDNVRVGLRGWMVVVVCVCACACVCARVCACVEVEYKEVCETRSAHLDYPLLLLCDRSVIRPR